MLLCHGKQRRTHREMIFLENVFCNCDVNVAREISCKTVVFVCVILLWTTVRLKKTNSVTVLQYVKNIGKRYGLELVFPVAVF